MKQLGFLVLIFLCTGAAAQKHTPLPHGMVFGEKPAKMGAIAASQLQLFMYNKTRITTMVRGKVLKVTKSKGGWFEMDGGRGLVIAAHFRDYNVTLPMELKGRTVTIAGVAAKKFTADDLQHLAGDTVNGKKQHKQIADSKHSITFEVSSLIVDK